ncbi:MAG TPA: hypothetical protein VGB19_15070 [Actinomycetota bacterium]
MGRKLSLAIVVLLVAVSIGLVAVAAATKSYVPLFLIWIPQIPIAWLAARSSQGRPAN